MLMPRSGRQPIFRLATIAAHCLLPGLLSGAFYLLSPNEISFLQWILAFVLLQIPWSSYLNWRRRPDEKLPIFAVISLMYWLFYVVTLFWGTRTPSGDDNAFEKTVSDESVTWALALALLGVSAVWLALRIGLGKRLLPERLPQLKPGLISVHYLRLLLILGTLMSFVEGIPFMAGEGGRQALTIIVTTVPLLAFAVLFRNVLAGEGQLLDKLLVLAFLAIRLIAGLSSGWLGSFASIIVVCAAVLITQRHRIPRLAVALVILFTLFFQVGKQEFRKQYWQDDAQASRVDRVKFWTETSLSKWHEALSDSSGEGLADAINSSLSRLSLLTQTANVLDQTPSAIPYQGYHLYSYLVVTWIPRAIWPNKPSMNEANQFYQVTYGLTREEDLQTVSIAVGVMTEAYISFGLLGVVCIMFLMGIVYDLYRSMFFSNLSSPLMTALGIALLPQMISIESQMAAYLGGIVQQVLFTLLVMIPVIRFQRRQKAFTLPSLQYSK